MAENSGLSFADFQEMYEQQLVFDRKIKENEETPKEDEESDEESDDEVEKIDLEDPIRMGIRKLCRICGCSGMIDIHSKVSPSLITIAPSRLARLQEVTIGQMIEQISSEKVDKTDLLPQFICAHCLSYLQHAYNLRLEIINTSKNLRTASVLASQDMQLNLEPSKTYKQTTQNQQEILESKEEIEEEKFLNEMIDKKKAKIKISQPTSTNKKDPVFEIKCPSCFRKSYCVKSHRIHMNNCMINILKTLFSKLQSLYARRFEDKITSHEYVIYFISIIYDGIKRIEIIAKKDPQLDIQSIIKTSPPDELLQIKTIQTPSASSNNNSFRWTSPDYGYFSSNQ